MNNQIDEQIQSRLIFFGRGFPLDKNDCYYSSMLFQSGAYLALVDCPVDVLEELRSIAAVDLNMNWWNDIDTIFITQSRPEYRQGLTSLIDQMQKIGRGRPLWIIAPSKTLIMQAIDLNIDRGFRIDVRQAGGTSDTNKLKKQTADDMAEYVQVVSFPTNEKQTCVGYSFRIEREQIKNNDRIARLGLTQSDVEVLREGKSIIMPITAHMREHADDEGEWSNDYLAGDIICIHPESVFDYQFGDKEWVKMNTTPRPYEVTIVRALGDDVKSRDIYTRVTTHTDMLVRESRYINTRRHILTMFPRPNFHIVPLQLYEK